jgi:hypothetical protein
MDEVARAVRSGDPLRAMEMELAVWAPLSAHPSAGGAVREIAMANAQVLCIDDSLNEPRPSAVMRLREIDAATLIVVGDEDLNETHAIADLLASSIPGALKRVIAEATSLVNVRRPERFNQVALDFLSFRCDTARVTALTPPTSSSRRRAPRIRLAGAGEPVVLRTPGCGIAGRGRLPGSSPRVSRARYDARGCGRSSRIEPGTCTPTSTTSWR